MRFPYYFLLIPVKAVIKTVWSHYQSCLPFTTDALTCLPPSPRVPGASDGHQRVPTEASGKWLVQPPPREAEAENNWDCPALPQQAAGARVLHLALPWGGGGKASPLIPLPCPNTGPQAHTDTHTHMLYTYTLTPFTYIHTHITHTQIFIFILYYFVIYMNTYINTVCLWLWEQSVKNHAKVEKLRFCVAASRGTFEWLKFNSLCSLGLMLCGKRVSACLQTAIQ